MKCLVYLSTIVVLSSMPLSAEIYKWVDEEGRVHFGDRVPEDKAAEKMDIPHKQSGSKAGKAATDQQAEQSRMAGYRERQKKLLDVWDKERAEQKKEAEKEKKHRDKLAKACERAKNKKAYGDRAQRWYNEKEDGTRHYLSEQERKKAERELAAYIAKVCK